MAVTQPEILEIKLRLMWHLISFFKFTYRICWALKPNLPKEDFLLETFSFGISFLMFVGRDAVGR